jgi:hypothetical protein
MSTLNDRPPRTVDRSSSLGLGSGYLWKLLRTAGADGGDLAARLDTFGHEELAHIARHELAEMTVLLVKLHKKLQQVQQQKVEGAIDERAM